MKARNPYRRNIRSERPRDPGNSFGFQKRKRTKEWIKESVKESISNR